MPVIKINNISQIQMQEEVAVPESKKYKNEKLPKQYKITVQLVSETSLDDKITQGLDEDQRLYAVMDLRSIHLEWLNIRKIENLEVFTNLNVLYLQHNKISKIQNLECLVNLQYLALNDNLISTVENLSSLKKLVGLNLSNNQIEDIEPTQLPKFIQMLSLIDNPITLDTNYKVDIIKDLPYIDVLDGITIAPQQKLKMIGKFPQNLLEYSEKLKYFRSKKQIKKRLDEENQPVYLGGTFEEKEALQEIREKTRKYMHVAKQQFAGGMKDQNQNFETKIKISRKIRNFKETENKKNMQMSQITEVKEEDD